MADFNLTAKWMKSEYARLNKLYFNDVLPKDIELDLEMMTNASGVAICRFNSTPVKGFPVVENPDGIYVSYLAIHMSTYFNHHSESNYSDTLAHEMIHIYQYTQLSCKTWRKDPHGATFLAEMNRINEDFGRKIDTHVTQEERHQYVSVYFYQIDDTLGAITKKPAPNASALAKMGHKVVEYKIKKEQTPMIVDMLGGKFMERILPRTSRYLGNYAINSMLKDRYETKKEY